MKISYEQIRMRQCNPKIRYEYEALSGWFDAPRFIRGKINKKGLLNLKEYFLNLKLFTVKLMGT